MSLLSKLMDTMRLNSDEDEEYFGPEDEYEADRPAKRSPFSSRDDGEGYDEGAEDSKPRFFSRSSKVVPMKKMEVSLIKPTSIEDAREICDYLLAGKAVVLNMEGIHTEVAQRIIDFTSGATYSMNGNLQKISSYIFIATPETVGLSGDFQDLLNSRFEYPDLTEFIGQSSDCPFCVREEIIYGRKGLYSRKWRKSLWQEE